MKLIFRILASLAFALSSAHAQDKVGNTPSAQTAITVDAAKDVVIVTKDVRDIIGFGGRIAVKDSHASVLGGAAGELKIAAGRIELDIGVTGDGDLAGGEVWLGSDMNVRGDMDILAGSVNAAGLSKLPEGVGWTLMGFLALALIGAIPIVERIIQILAIVTGAGAVLATAWALRRKPDPAVAEN